MTLLGGGGAASAIAVQAALDGIKELAILNQQDECFAKIVEIAKRINEKTACKATVYDLADKSQLCHQIAESTVLFNVTDVNMEPLEWLSLITEPTML